MYEKRKEANEERKSEISDMWKAKVSHLKNEKNVHLSIALVSMRVSESDIQYSEIPMKINRKSEDEVVVRWLSPLFELKGRETYMGVSGCGQSCKIANQIMICANLLGLGDGLVFAEKAARIIDRDFRPDGFAEYVVKDLGMGLDGVEDDVVVLPAAALSRQLYLGMVAMEMASLVIMV
ncbi:hypothetical protein NE237_032132 [Protea cynaroides]|uniref:Uncharacterized protein n=1 Tax=Protea cynaroides TaxID=273540 RepID=A0A9Q0R2T3_9MAGN|nr:hypothetical protein NE237_032132 [Protea cynaroides]